MKKITYEELIKELVDTRLTMVNPNEFDVIRKNHETISKIKGDIIECGVWKGGFAIFLSYIFPTKNIWVVDSFEGFQPLSEAKYEYGKKERHTPEVQIKIGLEEVQSNFEKYELISDERNIIFLKGFVKDVLPTADIKEIALLRIDVDAYSATLEVLNELYDKVQPGGYVIFDDSCLYETLDAIKTFFKERNIPEFLYHPTTDEKLDLNISHTNDDSGFPAGCYIIK